MAENAKDSDERDLRGGRCCAPVRLVDQERRAELDRQGHGRSFTGIQFLGLRGYATSVQGSPNLEERQSGDIRCFRMACAARPTRALLSGATLSRHYGREMQGRNEAATEDPVQQMDLPNTDLPNTDLPNKVDRANRRGVTDDVPSP
jgi:hypothetical protein